MSIRVSIEVEGLGHGGAPIPAACRLGNVIASGGISALDPAAHKLPDDLEGQARMMFANVRRIVEAAGGNVEHIIKMTFWVRDRAARAVIDPHWLEMFPKPESRPARHTLVYQVPDPMLIQCEFLAVVE
jgi:2-iminobutanoate/2-iminopropanoate deaminase